METIEIHKLIKDLRKTKGLTQKVLAEKLGCTQSFISKVEKGQSELTINMFIQLTELLNVSLIQFLYRHSFDQMNKGWEKQEFVKQTTSFNMKNDFKRLEEFMNEYNEADFFQIPHIRKMVLRFEGICKFHNHHNSEKAFALFNKALSIRSKSKAEQYQNMETLNAMGNCYYYLDQNENALECYHRARKMGKTLLHMKESDCFIRILNNLSLAYERKGKLERSMKMIEQAIDINVSRNSSYLMGHLYYQLARIYNFKKKLAESEKSLHISKTFTEVFHQKECFVYQDTLELVLELNSGGLWEYEGKWLTEYSNSELAILYCEMDRTLAT